MTKQHLSPGHVLLLDDQPDVGHWLKNRHLPRSGLDREQIFWRQTLADASAVVRRPPRLAGFLLDWRLGGEATSRALFEQVRALYPSTRTPLYVVTGAADDPDVVRFASRHHANVISKKAGRERWQRLCEELRAGRDRLVAIETGLVTRAGRDPLTPAELFVAVAVLDGSDAARLAFATGWQRRYVDRLERGAAGKLRVECLTALQGELLRAG